MSTASSVTCPECQAVLRPAKPLRAGKSVKCPKCGAGFVVGGEEPAPAAPRAKAPAGVQKKPPANVTPVAPVQAARDDDDDDDGGPNTYGFVTEGEQSAPTVSYELDNSIRDLRGPAMQQIVDPSNKLILVGATGFIGWVAFLVTLVIPILFPLQTLEEKIKEREAKARQSFARPAPRAGQPGEPEKKDDDTSFLLFAGVDLRGIGELPWYLIVPCLLPEVLGLVYSAVLSMGAVKIQNLESREWGIAASIMAMVPINAGGVLCMLALILNICLDFLFEGFFKWVMLCLFLLIAWGLNIAIGAWMLMVLNKPEVIAGFEYVPD